MTRTVLAIVTTLVINVKRMNLATRGTFREVGGRIFDTIFLFPVKQLLSHGRISKVAKSTDFGIEKFSKHCYI